MQTKMAASLLCKKKKKKSTTRCQLKKSGKINPSLEYVVFELVSYLSAASLKS